LLKAKYKIGEHTRKYQFQNWIKETYLELENKMVDNVDDIHTIVFCVGFTQIELTVSDNGIQMWNSSTRGTLNFEKKYWNG